MLYRENPELDEGELAKRRASLVSSVALAEIGRAIGLGPYVRLGRGETMTGGRDKASILADTVEAIIGAVYLDAGGDAATALVLRLIAPLLPTPNRFGAAMDPKTSLQELAARRGAPAAVVRGHRQRPRSHEALRRHGDRRRPRRGVGRGHEQEAGRDGRRARGVDAPATRPADDARASRGRGRPRRARSRGDRRDGRRRRGARRALAHATRRPDAGTSSTLADGRAASTPPCAAASSCGCRSAASARSSGHLGMSGQVLLRTPARRRDRHARIRLHLEHPEHGELRVDFVDQRIFGSMAVDRLVPTADGDVAGFSAGVTGEWARASPRRSPTSPATRSTRRSPTRRSSRRSRRRTSGVKRVLLDQGVISGVGNIYADESLWAVRLHPEQPASSISARRGARTARRRARGARQGARRGRHELRRAVRQRQRGIRILRALAERLRTRRAAVPAVRHGRWCASRS